MTRKLPSGLTAALLALWRQPYNTEIKESYFVLSIHRRHLRATCIRDACDPTPNLSPNHPVAQIHRSSHHETNVYKGRYCLA